MIKYIVGIDFGHGETAAWAVPLSEDNKAKLPLSGASLRLRASNDAQDRQLPSVIYRTPEGDYSLEFKTRYGIITQMKKRVAEMDAMDRQNYANYIHKIIERLKELNSDILAFEDGKPIFRLCMASPTKWSDEEKKEYLSFFNSAIEDMGLRFDWIIDESDAAFFSHCKEESDMQKCSLVIDYGSSTIDYTAIKNGRIISDKNWSNQQLGASLIENSMMMTVGPKKNEGYKDYAEMIIETKQMLESHNLEHIDPEQVLGFELRKLKEEKFKQQTDEYKLIFDFESITGDSEFESLTYVAKGKLSEVTQEYREAVRADLINLRNMLSQKLSDLNKNSCSQSIAEEHCPDRIILSGGACIMRWFTWMVRDVFGIQEIVDDHEPSFVVAKGIALYARAQDLALKRFIDRILSIDYSQIYKKADIWATGEGVKKFVDRPIRQISSSPMTGINIRETFCEFIQGLNSRNSEYCDLVQTAVDESLSKRVSDELADAIQEVFHVNLSINDISIHIPVIILDWKASDFQPGGAWHNNFTGAIEQVSPRYNFTWDKTRDTTEASQIANGVKKLLLDVDYNKLITYNSDFLNSHGDSIKQQTKKIAIDLFFDYQLFKTTFAEIN